MAGERPILVLGGTGKLGTALVERLAALGRPALAPSRARLDLTVVSAIGTALTAVGPGAVINAAAYNDVNRAETPPDAALAFLLNRDAPAALARACRSLDVPLIHVSTDYVFDGAKREPYREEDPTAPLQVYGRSKLDGERAVLEEGGQALVARTATVYGRDRRGGSNYVDKVILQARQTGKLEVVRLPIASTTYAPDLAEALIELLHARAQGILHVANEGGCSRMDFAREALRHAGIDAYVRERPAPDGEPPRPPYSVLDTGRVARLLGRPMRPWGSALRAYLGRVS